MQIHGTPTTPGVVVLAPRTTVYCAFHDPSDVDCRREDKMWVVRVARGRQTDGQGVMEPHLFLGRRAFQPAAFPLVNPHAGRKIVAFSAYEALMALHPLIESGLQVPPKAIDSLQQEVRSAG